MFFCLIFPKPYTLESVNVKGLGSRALGFPDSFLICASV